MGDVLIHWGGPLIQSLCGSESAHRYTTVRLVTCRYCQNIIDRHLHETLVSTPPVPGASEGDGRG